MNHKGDFLSLLSENGCQIQLIPNHSGVGDFSTSQPSGYNSRFELIEGTTVVAVHYKDGVLIAGDRRATAGNVIMYDRADKVLPIDEYSALAIAGSPAIAYEMARVLQHSFQYFRRSQLQELSVEGKLRMLSRLIRENLPMALQGIGGVLPIFALYDPHVPEGDRGGRIFFYDALGAHFENVDFATSGSGSIWIRGTLHHLDRWGETRLVDMTQQQAVTTVLRLLDTASEYDSATSGYNSKSSVFPTIKTITREGIQDLSEAQMGEIYTEFVEINHAR